MFNHPDIDQQKAQLLEQTIRRVNEEFVTLCNNEIINSPDHMQAVMTMVMCAPLTFFMNVIDILNKHAPEQFSKEFPDVFKVYQNYAKAMGDLDHDWNTMGFEEFQEKFVQKYKELGHYTHPID